MSHLQILDAEVFVEDCRLELLTAGCKLSHCPLGLRGRGKQILWFHASTNAVRSNRRSAFQRRLMRVQFDAHHCARCSKPSWASTGRRGAPTRALVVVVALFSLPIQSWSVLLRQLPRPEAATGEM